MPKIKLSCHEWSERVSYVTKIRQDNDVIDRTSVVYAKSDIELSWLIRLGAIYDENHYMTDRNDVVYVENDIKKPWSIWLGSVYDENQMGQRHDW